jgi:tetratricopeptide (TPR) repeat protein
MAYHKTKHAEAAQKYLHQGKIAQAVAEYQIILKHEPKDQVTLMTVGDLFVRQGETFQALEYFERLAQIYLSDGFLTKAIAIYKKITKLAPEETRPVERLADLYVQQGVMSEARPIYLQLAEMHQRAQRPAQAAGLLRKLLDAEPDNVRVQSRLAELSMSMGQPAEAVAALRTAAQQLHRRGDHAEAIVFADRALKIDGADGGTLALRARALVGAGKRDDAVKMLESLRDLDAGGEAAGLLVDLYLEAGDTGRASALAERIVARDAKRYAVAQRVATSLLEASQAESALAILRLIRQAMVEAGEQERFAELLVRAAEALPKEIEPREMLVEVYRHTSDSFRLPDALIHLAEVYEAAGQPGPACKTYEQYLERDPENEAIRHRHERVQARLGQAGHGADAAVAPAAEEAEPPAAPGVSEQGSPDQGLDEETRLFVSQALTDVDLYSSYGLTQKALDLLDIVLQRAPNHTVALERLLDLSLGLGDETRTVELAARLEQIYGEYGDKTAAERFADLRRRFERNAGVAAPAAPTEAASQAAVPAEPAGPMEFAIPVVDAEPEPANGEAGEGEILSESVVHEVDLSEEWAAVAGQAGETTMVDPAEPAGPDQGVLQESDVGAGPLAEELFAEYELAVDDAAASGPADGSPESVDSFIRSISAELDAILPAPASTPSGPAGPASALGGGAADLTEAVASRARDAQTGGPLGDLFDQFRADLGETSEKEDPETHYNLGIAYREMGLLEEAISEFQKVAKAHQRGQAFGYAMQCYTLLALAFVDKGQPSIAVTWYERALAIPDLEQESVLALRYDLGVAQEMAGDMEAAHKSFSQVYGTNIDYRDVAERLAALGRAR